MVDTTDLSLFISDDSLQQYFVDKDTGLPLASGWVYFWQDTNRNSLKPVYQLTGSPPNYQMVALANPLQLSNTGTFIDDNGNDIAVYYCPFDDFGNVDNYFVQVFSSNVNGVIPPTAQPQFTRENWPNVNDGNNPSDLKKVSGVTNIISNPQFEDVLFDPAYIFESPFSGSGTTVLSIAPGWDLEIVHTNSGSVTIKRNALAGSAQNETNPPYSLSITGNPNISNLYLRQRFSGNPNIWATQFISNAYLASSVTLSPASHTIEMYYRPSAGAYSGANPFLLLTGSNPNGYWSTIQNTVLMPAGDNTQVGGTGYVDILVKLNNVATNEITSIQIASLADDIANVSYEEEPIARQTDHLFHYYKPQLEYKPIPSYLVGWDFALNPAQFFGDSVPAQAVGANKSFYAWDQTIIFQSTNSGVSVSRTAADGSIKINADQATQLAVIQYLDTTQAIELLSGKMAVNIVGSASASYTGVVSLYACTDATLPDMNSNNSIVLTLNADGSLATTNGTWDVVSKNGLPITYLGLTTTQTEFNFNGWDGTIGNLASTAKFFAIVISFPQLAQNDYITLNSVSLCRGDIATVPAPKTADETLRDCERYFEKSYSSNVAVFPAPPVSTMANAIAAPQNWVANDATHIQATATSFNLNFRTLKRSASPTVKLYSPISGTSANTRMRGYVNQINVFDTEQATTVWTQTVGDKSVSFQAAATSANISVTTAIGAGQPISMYILYQYTADARLGIVN